MDDRQGVAPLNLFGPVPNLLIGTPRTGPSNLSAAPTPPHPASPMLHSKSGYIQDQSARDLMAAWQRHDVHKSLRQVAGDGTATPTQPFVPSHMTALAGAPFLTPPVLLPPPVQVGATPRLATDIRSSSASYRPPSQPPRQSTPRGSGQLRASSIEARSMTPTRRVATDGNGKVVDASSNFAQALTQALQSALSSLPNNAARSTMGSTTPGQSLSLIPPVISADPLRSSGLGLPLSVAAAPGQMLAGARTPGSFQAPSVLASDALNRSGVTLPAAPSRDNNNRSYAPPAAVGDNPSSPHRRCGATYGSTPALGSLLPPAMSYSVPASSTIVAPASSVVISTAGLSAAASGTTIGSQIVSTSFQPPVRGDSLQQVQRTASARVRSSTPVTRPQNSSANAEANVVKVTSGAASVQANLTTSPSVPQAGSSSQDQVTVQKAQAGAPAGTIRQCTTYAAVEAARESKDASSLQPNDKESAPRR